MIVDSANLCIGYARRLLDGIQPADFSKFARVGDTTIQSNHPAFIFGHLSLYPVRIVSELGDDATSIQPSSAFDQLFSPSATCQDDPDGTIYPAMNEITERFFVGYDAAIAALRAAPDDQFTVENPNEKMRAKFKTKGSMHAFYVSGHMMIHLGQLSAWRRAMGLPPA